MRILVFDTETTGLPERNASIYEIEKWPYILQLSYIFYDVSNNISVIKDQYINISKDIEISNESFEKHGITREKIDSKGINIQNALLEFNTYLSRADLVIGHNISFDKRMIFVECSRNRIKQQFTTFRGKNKISKQEYCTMKNSVELCDLYYTTQTGKILRKYPTLSELYMKLFPDIILPANLHNSIIDVAVTLRCYIKIKYDNDICCINPDISNILSTTH